MALGTKVSGTWHTVQYAHVNVSSTWRHVPQVYVNVNGTWRPLFSFTWEQGAWSGCSATCGGGTQTRTVRCKRNDGTYWDDSVCSNFVGAKPSTSQACNTQACGHECYYSYPNLPHYYWVRRYVASSSSPCVESSVTNATIVTINEWRGNPPVSATTAIYNGVTYTRGTIKLQKRDESNTCLWYHEVCVS